MKKYVFAKRTMYVFKREDGPFTEDVINALDSRFITEGRCVAIDDPNQEAAYINPKLKVSYDMNGDGKVNKKDVSLMAKGLRKLSSKKKKGKK